MQKESKSASYFPTGLFTLFGSESTARFCFWSVQSVIVLYLIKKFLISDSQSYAIAASYEALTYAATFLGGYCADKYFGALRTLMLGIFLSAVGALLLAVGQVNLIYLGLAFMVVGMGFYMPTNATLIDHLYETDNPHRERAFFYFYVATNLGCCLGPLLFGFLFEYSHWLSFTVLSTLLAIFLLIYLFSAKRIQYLRVNPEHLNINLSKTVAQLLIVCLSIVVVLTLMKHQNLTRDLLFAVGVFAIGWILFKTKRDAATLKKQVYMTMFFSITSLFFFAMEFQIINSIITFTRDFVDKNYLGLHIPPSSFVSLEPFGVICMAPVVTMCLEKFIKQETPSLIFNKFAGSFFFLSLSFLALIIPSKLVMMNGQQVSGLWLVLSGFFMGTGEVLMMPVLLALVTKDVPEGLKNTMVGFLYLCIAFSSYFAGVVATLTKSFATTSAITGYYNTYSAIFLFLIVVCVGLYLLGRRAT